MGQWVYMNGKTVPAEEAVISPYDHGFLYGDGVFEGIRIYGGRVFKLREHIERLFASARALMIVMPGSVEQMIESVLQLVKMNECEDGYVRITVSRGVGLGLDPRVCKCATVIVMTDKLALYPPEMYTNGLEVVTVSTRIPPAQSIEPRVKSLGKYLCNIQAKIEANRVGAGEGLMLNIEGYVAEATGDNIFLIKNGRIMTPPSYAGILEGITRNTVMELARAREYPLRESLFTLFDVYTSDECFLTGTAAEVIPVVRVDGRTIGAGIPGPITLDLISAFRELTQSEGMRA
ncbi:MAG: branched-chain-amino-acid transaminase [Armatimonadota bacterium]|nr:branched-chain-amino-acid transaminase [Armatimonadota bacterium]